MRSRSRLEERLECIAPGSSIGEEIAPFRKSNTIHVPGQLLFSHIGKTVPLGEDEVFLAVNSCRGVVAAGRDEGGAVVGEMTLG
jgi:hypothetical protein